VCWYRQTRTGLELERKPASGAALLQVALLTGARREELAELRVIGQPG
jgi:hypothetical protein